MWLVATTLSRVVVETKADCQGCNPGYIHHLQDVGQLTQPLCASESSPVKWEWHQHLLHWAVVFGCITVTAVVIISLCYCILTTYYYMKKT